MKDAIAKCCLGFLATLVVAVLLGASQSPSEAVQVARSINTAEHYIHQKNGTYADWERMLSERSATHLRSEFVAPGNDGGSGSVTKSGLQVRLIVSPEQDKYIFAIADPNQKCEPVTYSDERGLIVVGKALGCK